MKKQSFFIIMAGLCLLIVVVASGAANEETSSYSIWQSERINVNRIDLAFSNYGDLGQRGTSYYPSGGGISFLWAGGIALSGYVNDTLKTAWIFHARRISEFQPGIWGMDSENPDARIYSVSHIDTPDSRAFQDWAKAVEMGAPYQDINLNGRYDPTFDKPLQIGDRLFWSAFNDNTSPSDRTALRSKVLGIEVQQSIWAYDSEKYLGDVVFIHYRIINRSNSLQKELIFTSIHDPDLGAYNNDLIGCDTLLNLGFCYDNGSDSEYGLNVPAFGIQLLSSPYSTQSGSKAVVFDYENKAQVIIKGKKSCGFSSFIKYFEDLHWTNRDQEVRNLQLGLTPSGHPIDPVNYPFGSGASDQTNPYFLFSGDPISGDGWLDDPPDDKNFMINSGPFDLAAGDTMDVLLAMIVARGKDALDSITEVRKRARFLQRMLHEDARELKIYCAQDSFDMDFAAHLEAQAMGLTVASQLPVDTEIEWSIDEKPEDGVAILLALDSLRAVFKAYRPGTHKIKAMLAHKSGEVDTIYKTLYATDDPLSLDSDKQTAGSFRLRQNYPNPFNPSTTIVYELPRREQVTIDIFDSAGRKVATLLDGRQNGGRHKLTFNASHLASGVYYYRLTAGRFVQTRKMLLIK